MISNILPIVALAAAAMAACPLSVEIASATDHIAQVTVTNTSNETLTVFKGNTVLSDHATKDLLVTDAGMLSSSLSRNITNTMDRWQRPPLRGNLRQL